MMWLWLVVVGVMMGVGESRPSSSGGEGEEGAKFIFIVSDPASHPDVSEVLASVPERSADAAGSPSELAKGEVLASGPEERVEDEGGMGAGAVAVTVLGSVVAVCALGALTWFVVVPAVRRRWVGKGAAESRPSSGAEPRATQTTSFPFSLASLRRHQKKLDYRREQSGDGTGMAAGMAAAGNERATEGTAETMTTVSLSERKGPTTPTSLLVRTANDKGLTGLSHPSSDLTTDGTHAYFAPSTANCPYDTSVCPFIASSATNYTRSTHPYTHPATHDATHDATTQLISTRHN